MRYLQLTVLFLLSFVYLGIAQVPTPMSTNTTSGLQWTKTNEYDFVLKKNGNTIATKDLKYLKTNDLAVLGTSTRNVYLLKNFREAASGTSGNVEIVAKNVGKNFYITNPQSFAFYVNDVYYTGDFSNINGSYIFYLEEKDKTYMLPDIRSFSNWGAKSAKDLAYSADHLYWCRVAETNSYHFIKKGKAIDYDNITSEFRGDDLILKENGLDKYQLQGYKNTASYVFKPGKLVSGGGVSAKCVRGDCQNGWGKQEYEGGHYDGFWKNGKKDGYGLYKWEGIGKYIGNWENDQMKGYGVYIADNNDNIAGVYGKGQLNGPGFTVTNDTWEQGLYVDGKLTTPYTFYTTGNETGCTAGDCQNKYGRFKWGNGDQFTGFFKDGNLYMGSYTFANGDKYSGMFNSSNQFHGMGRFFFKAGGYYGGEWKNGQYDGKGYYHNKDYEQQIGVWSNGKLVQSLKKQ